MLSVTISGLSGSGTTTVGKLVSKKINLPFISAGDVFRELAKKREMSIIDFVEYTRSHPNIDIEVDNRQIEIAKLKSVVLEGRLTGILASKNKIPSIKIWLEAPLEIRAQRVSCRENKTVTQTKKEILKRDRFDEERYQKIYDIDINDLSYYTKIIDTTKNKPDAISNFIVEIYKNAKSSSF